MIKPNVTECDDGSILIEFIKHNKRFTISFEVDIQESSWNYVETTKDGMNLECWGFDEKFIETFEKFQRE